MTKGARFIVFFSADSTVCVKVKGGISNMFEEALLSAFVPVDSGEMDTMLTDLLDESMDSECLGSMTPETQDIYLRLDSHRRRSGLRLARIIARQQLLKKISQGMRGALGNNKYSVFLLHYYLHYFCLYQQCIVTFVSGVHIEIWLNLDCKLWYLSTV